MTVLVTGATGFIGRHVVDRLICDREKVRIFTRDPRRVPAAWLGRVEVLVGDITDKSILRRAVDGADVIYHLAGEIRDAGVYETVNHAGTRNLLEASAEEGSSRFLHYSSVGVIGALGHGQYDEKSPCHPRNGYELSKFLGERAVLEYSCQRRLPVIVVRPTIVFGPRIPGGQDSFLAWMQAIRCGHFRLIGRESAIANYVYVEDVAESCIRLARDHSAIGEVFHIADPCTVKEFTEWAAHLLGARHPGYVPKWLAFAAAAGFEATARVIKLRPPLTISRAKVLTSRSLFVGDKLHRRFDLPIGWRQGLERTILAYRNSGLLP